MKRNFSRQKEILPNAKSVQVEQKHTTQVMWGMTGATVLFTVIPFKFAIMSLAVYLFMASSKAGKSASNTPGDRRLREWYAIPVVPVRTASNPL